ncbi:hypothetical protein HMPREF0201_02040 [Cedecea davisae DSM 4568]|uniref:Uncharacterized protein n=2 Tax=Cedecea davisae TaxID=158484 RepID=S3IXJ7_9ENTR|nr:hypothetical protein [Cedecea davisae]EPF17236.1 hypothetical protein HMPREF0201_02040 [Cedecea davisae DSM 4568]
MDKVLDTGEWVMQRGGSADDAAWSLVASDNATIRRDYIRLLGEGDDNSTAWSGRYKNEFGNMYGEVHEDMIFDLRGARLETEGNSLSLDFSSCPERTTQFASAIWHCGGLICAYNYKKAALSFRLSGQGTNAIKVNAESEIIQIQPNVGNLRIINNFDEELAPFIDYVGQRSQMSGQMESQLDNALTATILGSIGSVNFESISVFAVDHILFPEQNINQLKSAGLPGDMIVFGDISPALTSLNVTPLNTTIAAGKTVQFTANASVGWNVSPSGAGSISASGLYRAPENIHGVLQSVKITATGRNKGTASAYVAVVPSSVMILPAFAAIKEVADTQLSLQFSATMADCASLAGWSVSPEESTGPTGAIDKNGLYTTPSDAWPKGYSWVTVTASASDGSTATARVLLVSRTAHAEFPLTPPLLTEMPLESVQLFSATGDGEINPEVWGLHPQEGSGTLSDLKVTGNEDEPKYTVTYTAPESVTGDKLVIIATMAEDMPLRSGYALVDLASEKANPWSLLEGVSTLRVTSEVGSGEAELYKNGVNQAAVNIQFTGFRTDKETGRPEYISVELDDILPHMKLVDYVTGEELPRGGSAGWVYTVQENSYKRLPVSGVANQIKENVAQNVNTYTLYVTCDKDEQSSAKRIAVSVELKDGTVISTANGESSGFDSSLIINGRPGIIYSVNKGVSVTAPSAPVTKMMADWASLDVAVGCYTDRDDQCEIRIDKFIISPNANGITEFRTGKFSDGVIDDITISNIQTMWKDKQEFVFDCLSGSGRQCAVMGVTTKDVQEGSANIWFAGPTVILNKGQIYFSDENKDVIYRVSIPEFSDTEGQDQTCITLLKVKTPIAVKPYRWTSVDLEPDLVITDDYGNTGRLHFKWDESEYYDKPYIS